MGACLVMTDEKRAYTLADRGTFLAQQDKLDLEILFAGDPVLENPYSAIAVRPEHRPGGNHAGAVPQGEWRRLLPRGEATRRRPPPQHC